MLFGISRSWCTLVFFTRVSPSIFEGRYFSSKSASKAQPPILKITALGRLILRSKEECFQFFWSFAFVSLLIAVKAPDRVEKRRFFKLLFAISLCVDGTLTRVFFFNKLRGFIRPNHRTKSITLTSIFAGLASLVNGATRLFAFRAP